MAVRIQIIKKLNLNASVFKLNNYKLLILLIVNMDFELDDEWAAFKSQTVPATTTANRRGDVEVAAACGTAPHRQCTPIYISTTTKIAYLNAPVDIRRVFWEIPIVKYTDEREGVIKKQIKFSTTDRDDYQAVMDRIAKERYADNQEIEHIDNPEGRIKFKDQRKISIGMSKKDILCYRSKRKRAFFNCFVIILRIYDAVNDRYSEMHVKVFNTGKLEIPGIQTNEMLAVVLEMVVAILKQYVGPNLSCIPGKCDTVLINSNFNCGFYINRDKLHNLLKYKYRINSNYDSCSYPGIQSKFYYIPSSDPENAATIIQSGQQPANGIECYEISFMIFRTGSVLIVGKCTEPVLYVIYDFIKNILESEYDNIANDVGTDPLHNAANRKKPAVKIQRRTIIVTSSSSSLTLALALAPAPEMMPPI